MMPAAAQLAAFDRHLMPRDLSVYVFLYSQLDNVGYRPIKHAWLARRVGLSRANAARAVRRLLDRGYLEQGPNDGGLRTYRITLSPDPNQAQHKDKRERVRVVDRDEVGEGAGQEQMPLTG